MFERYVIKNGESLNEVAKKYNTSVKILTDLNNIYLESDIRAGMEIVVPTESKDYFNYYVVEKGDNLYAIARKYNINPQLLANINGLDEDDYIYPNEQILIPKSGYSYYITAEGDTIDEVVKAFGSNINKFLNENKTIYLMKDQLLVNKKN